MNFLNYANELYKFYRLAELHNEKIYINSKNGIIWFFGTLGMPRPFKRSEVVNTTDNTCFI